MGSEHYCLRWNNHQSNLLGVFSQLLRDESLVDVTLACSEGHSIRAHKVVLSACSSYFQTLFIDHPSRHPIVILKDVRFSELRTLIEFMYKGEVNVEYCQLSALLKTAESLKVKGLAEMTRDCKTENEQNEPTELVTRKPHQQLLMQTQPPVATIVRHEDDTQEHTRSSPVLGICKESPDSEKETTSNSNDNLRSESPMMCAEDDVPNDMTIHNNTAVTSSHLPPPCGRLSPQIKSESLPGTSLLPPVQQVPLSLKKEVDWGGGSEEKNTKDPPEYSRSQDQELDSCVKREREGSPRMFPCIYCGQSFPHQSKLTRHILSHSLETLKYREMHQQHPALSIPPEAGPPYIESPYAARVPMMAHEPPDPTDQPPTQMDLDVGESAAMAAVSSGSNSGVVLCKFCGKSFPDVSSLISHLPVHTGDRPFKCEFCGKAFKLRHHMKDHCRVHTGERPFRCSLCGKTFSRSTILKAHEKTHYPKYVRKFLSPSPLDNDEESPH